MASKFPLSKVMVIVSLVSIVIAVIGFMAGFPFLGFFLFVPWFAGAFSSKSDDPSEQTVKKCPECGHQLAEDTDFCVSCGRKLRRLAVTTTEDYILGSK